MPCQRDVKISKRDAARRGSTEYSVMISLTIGPQTTTATVLFAVAKSTADAMAAIPN